MPNESKLKLSCYYVESVIPKRGKPRGRVHKSKRWGTYSDKMTVIVHVDPKKHMFASIEASATLAIDGKLGLAYVRKGVWRLTPEAPYGIGCYGQPLVPHRDFAHGHTGAWTWPFGTRLDVAEKPGDLPMRNTLYCADRFGKSATAVREKKAHRIDCFTGDPHQDVALMKAVVRKPWTGPDADARWWQLRKKRSRARFRRPGAGAQMCLNILGFKDANGNALAEDDAPGSKTLHALEVWRWSVRRDGTMFDFANLPKNIHPRDPEIYWALREAARRKHEAG